MSTTLQALPVVGPLETCDRCIAHPVMAVLLDESHDPRVPLLFCGHHYREHEAALAVKHPQFMPFLLTHDSVVV